MRRTGRIFYALIWALAVSVVCAQRVSATDEFSWRLLGAVTQEKPSENRVVSPTGLFAILGPLYLGSGGETRREICDTLAWNGSDEALSARLAALWRPAAEKSGSQTYWTSETAAWTCPGAVLDTEFLSRVEPARIQFAAVDFAQERQAASDAVSAWFAERLGEKFAGAGDLFSPDTRLVLANATAFRGIWKKPFSAEATRNEYFTDLDGNDGKVAMMRKRELVPYAQTDRFRWISLPYADERFAMEIILPDERLAFDLFEEQLTDGEVEQMKSQAVMTELDIRIPRFAFDADLRLDTALIRLGMPSAFGVSADFSRLCGAEPLFVSKIIQKISVDVSESGTEAAAATSAALLQKSAVPPLAELFAADHPFVFVIRSNETGEAIFIGRFVRPTQALQKSEADIGGMIR